MPTEFLIFEEFSDLLQGRINYKYWLKLGREGKAPKAHRITPNSKPVFDSREVEAWLAERGIKLFEELYDGEPSYGHC